MARVLNDFDFGTTNGIDKQQKYPWTDWTTDGKFRELKHGDDFNCKPQTMAMMARSYAKTVDCESPSADD